MNSKVIWDLLFGIIGIFYLMEAIETKSKFRKVANIIVFLLLELISIGMIVHA